ncbi:nuclear transport factor 2 family protein [Gymnodinialimonas ulvae]|uniref:nuclear transport factor 2 family protein n=1 Tax=Gymnodinialimonas ulvae TaxID=3126504 RepID=UPI003096A8A7
MTRQDACMMMQAFYSECRTNCPETTSAHFTPEAQFAIAGAPRAGPIAMCTPDGAIDQTTKALVSEWEFRTIDLHSVIAEGDEIFTRYTLTLRHVPTDTTTQTEFADHIRVRDGKM